MIKVFGGEYSINKNESQLKCTTDILDSMNLNYTQVETIRAGETWDIIEILKKHENTLSSNDLIIIDNYSHHDGEPHIKLNEFPNLKFLIFCYDLVNEIQSNDLYYKDYKKNYKIVTPVVFDVNDINSFNYYSWNYIKSKDFEISKYLFDSFQNNLKEKKFIAPFGFLRWDRFLTYQSLYQNNHLDSGWTSFSMKYNYGQKDWSFFENQLIGFDITESDLDLELLNNIKNNIPFSFDRNTSNEYIKKYSQNSFANTNSRLELLFRHNSYVGIVNDTQPSNEIPFYTSEKLWKPFCTFQFPFIIGNLYSYKFLKNIGFDMFEDVFELNLELENIKTKDLVKLQLESLNKFLSKNILEIHEIYQECKLRFIHNYETMIKYGKSQELHLNRYINTSII